MIGIKAVLLKKIIFLFLILFSSAVICQEQYVDPANMKNMFQLDTTSITKDGDFVIFKYKDDVSHFPAKKYNYIIYTVRSQCNDVNIELIDAEAQLQSDGQVKNIYEKNYFGKKYDANKPFDLLTKYACSIVNQTHEAKQPIAVTNPNQAIADKKSQDDEAQKLCKSYGLKKGTKDYVDCMLKIRAQDLDKETQLQRNTEEAARAEQNLVAEKNKKQQEDMKAIQDQRIKDQQDAAFRSQQQKAYQMQEARARCDNARQNMAMFCALANKPKNNPYEMTDLGAVWDCSTWRNEVSNACR